MKPAREMDSDELLEAAEELGVDVVENTDGVILRRRVEAAQEENPEVVTDG